MGCKGGTGHVFKRQLRTYREATGVYVFIIEQLFVDCLVYFRLKMQ